MVYNLLLLFVYSFHTHTQECQYICFDGDMDPLYLDNMRTIMDDSRMLTLVNGDCIQLENHCRIVFEVNVLLNPLFNYTLNKRRRRRFLAHLLIFQTGTDNFYVVVGR